MRLEPTARAVARQLQHYGTVTPVDSRTGTFTDRTGRVWSWSVFGEMAEFTRDGWRTRQVTVDKVSKYMFEWLLYGGRKSREKLNFSLGLEEIVETFGMDGAHQAFLKYKGAA